LRLKVRFLAAFGLRLKLAGRRRRMIRFLLVTVDVGIWFSGAMADIREVFLGVSGALPVWAFVMRTGGARRIGEADSALKEDCLEEIILLWLEERRLEAVLSKLEDASFVRANRVMPRKASLSSNFILYLLKRQIYVLKMSRRNYI